MTLTIPDDWFTSISISEQDLLLELAVNLYATQKISFGKARQLAGLDWYRFRTILSERGISAHYGVEQLEEDLKNLEMLPPLQ
jgi:predicted HTH domain antitoxin